MPLLAQEGGAIVNLSSIFGRVGRHDMVAYAASKGGVDMLMQTLAQEVSHQRIRINGIAPGAIRTDINRDANEEQLLKLIPYGRVGEVEDIANALVFLASDASDYIVGTTLFIDGGMSLYPEFRGNG
jgi:glucose 1-dehydrogenase